jgi:hypothetical protein
MTTMTTPEQRAGAIDCRHASLAVQGLDFEPISMPWHHRRLGSLVRYQVMDNIREQDQEIFASAVVRALNGTPLVRR